MATDPDSFYGPGGLSARQIMDELQKSRAKEAEAARAAGSRSTSQQKAQKATAQSEESVARMSEAELMQLTSKELRQRLQERQVDISDCFERADLVERARSHLC